MGYVIECRDAGFPAELLIPIEPGNPENPKSGKAPAVLNSIGEWVGLADWANLTTPWDVKAQADADGANCGLVLGCSGNTQDGPIAFAAVDIDLYEGQEEHRDRFVNLIAANWPAFTLLV